jgi:polyhydroxybutyrate depolymerase
LTAAVVFPAAVMLISPLPSAAARKSVTQTIEVRVGDRIRTYQFSASRRASQPLVIQLHGGNGSGRSMEGLTGFHRLGTARRFAVASPDGVGGDWNDGRTGVDSQAFVEQVDDVAFLDAIIADAAKRASINLSQVFVVGISNGAFMANRYACERPQQVRGIGLVAGTVSPVVQATCLAPLTVKVINFHGRNDPLVPYEGGTVARTRGEAASVESMLEMWRRNNECQPTPTVFKRPAYVKRSWKCTSPVVAYELLQAGHVWPGGPQYAPRALIGDATQAINATQEMWKFFGPPSA